MESTPGERFCQHVSEYLIAHQLRSLGQIDRKQLALLYDDFQTKEKAARKSRVGQTAASPVSDEEWVKGLYKLLAYEGIDVAKEVEKCRVWSQINRKVCTKRRILAWLNRVDRPISSPQSSGSPDQRNAYNIKEPMGWRERFDREHPGNSYTSKSWPEIVRDAPILKLVLAL